MDVEIGPEAAQFPEKEYFNGIFVAVWSPTRFFLAWLYGGGGMSWSQNQQRRHSAEASFIYWNTEACWFYYTVLEEKKTLPDATI